MQQQLALREGSQLRTNAQSNSTKLTHAGWIFLPQGSSMVKSEKQGGEIFGSVARTGERQFHAPVLCLARRCVISRTLVLRRSPALTPSLG
jgi:hypothetical protein